MDKKLTIINIVLALLAIFFAYLVFDSIRQPVVFTNAKNEREIKVVQSLKDIRSTQGLFKENYNRYTADFDSLIEFIKVGNFLLSISFLIQTIQHLPRLSTTLSVTSMFWIHCLAADLTSTLSHYATFHSQNLDKNLTFKLVTSHVVV